MLALRHTAAVLRLGRELVAFQHQHPVEVRGERPGRAQTGGTAPEDDGGLAEPHADQLPSFIQMDTKCMNDGRRVSRSRQLQARQRHVVLAGVDVAVAQAALAEPGGGRRS